MIYSRPSASALLRIDIAGNKRVRRDALIANGLYTEKSSYQKQRQTFAVQSSACTSRHTIFWAHCQEQIHNISLRILGWGMLISSGMSPLCFPQISEHPSDTRLAHRASDWIVVSVSLLALKCNIGIPLISLLQMLHLSPSSAVEQTIPPFSMWTRHVSWPSIMTVRVSPIWNRLFQANPLMPGCTRRAAGAWCKLNWSVTAGIDEAWAFGDSCNVRTIQCVRRLLKFRWHTD